jgi:hypothetical protein
MSSDDRLLRSFLRTDLSLFVEKAFLTLEPGTPYLHNWHIDHLCWQLMRVERGELRRLIINVPPRSMKSITVSVAFTAWLLGRDPAKKMICVSYADELARKLAVDSRIVIDSPWYRELFPRMQLRGRRVMELATTMHGYRFAAGMNGSILGRGADLIVIDDPIKATDALSAAERRRVNEAFDNTLYTRLNDKRRAAIVVIMQRLHERSRRPRDRPGRVGGGLIAGDRHRRSDLPAQRQARRRPYPACRRPPPRRPRAARSPPGTASGPGQSRVLGPVPAGAVPPPPGGNIVKREWLRTYARPPEPFDLVIASWDTASTLSETADWSVGTVWGAKGLDFYLLDLMRGRFEVPELRRAVRCGGADRLLIQGLWRGGLGDGKAGAMA